MDGMVATNSVICNAFVLTLVLILVEAMAKNLFEWLKVFSLFVKLVNILGGHSRFRGCLVFLNLYPSHLTIFNLVHLINESLQVLHVEVKLLWVSHGF